MKIAILRCGDCGTELNRTRPFPNEDERLVRISSALAAGRCPKGCRSTFSDLNINTTLEIIDAPSDPEEPLSKTAGVAGGGQ